MSERKTACVGPFRVVQEHVYSTEAFVMCDCPHEDAEAYSHIVAVCKDYPGLRQANSLPNAEMVAGKLNAFPDLVEALQRLTSACEELMEADDLEDFYPVIEARAALKKARGE